MYLGCVDWRLHICESQVARHQAPGQCLIVSRCSTAQTIECFGSLGPVLGYADAKNMVKSSSKKYHWH